MTVSIWRFNIFCFKYKKERTKPIANKTNTISMHKGYNISDSAVHTVLISKPLINKNKSHAKEPTLRDIEVYGKRGQENGPEAERDND